MSEAAAGVNPTSTWAPGRRVLIAAAITAVLAWSIALILGVPWTPSDFFSLWWVENVRWRTAVPLGVAIWTLVYVFAPVERNRRLALVIALVFLTIGATVSSIRVIRVELMGLEHAEYMWQWSSTAYMGFVASMAGWVTGVFFGRAHPGAPPSRTTALVLISFAFVPFITFVVETTEWVAYLIGAGAPYSDWMYNAAFVAMGAVGFLVAAILSVAVFRGRRSLAGAAALLLFAFAASEVGFGGMGGPMMPDLIRLPLRLLGHVGGGVLNGALIGIFVAEAWPALRRSLDDEEADGDAASDHA